MSVLRPPASYGFRVGGRSYTPSRVKAAQWPAVAADIGTGPPDRPAYMAGSTARQGPPARKPSGRMCLDQAGQPVLYIAGAHVFLTASGYVRFPGQRWLQFPVRGTDRSNAIMTAVDQAGRQVARYRIAPGRGFIKWREIEITVHPDHQLTDELLLMLALTAPWVSGFFDNRNGGG